MLFHPLNTEGITLPRQLNNPFAYQPDRLCRRAWMEVCSWHRAMGLASQFCQEIAKGKMFGVLVAETESHAVGFLAAFSGQICGRFCWDGYVPPVIDYLNEDGYFKIHEREISAINSDIKHLEDDVLAPLSAQYAQMQAAAEERIHAAETTNALHRAERHRRRAMDNVTATDSAEMIRQSQHEKAELRRLRQTTKAELCPLRQRIDSIRSEIDQQRQLRRQRSEALQQWLFDNTILHNSRGEELSASAIFSRDGLGQPPSGTGECCAPKLLDYAFTHHLRPIAMAEYWVGSSPQGEVRHNGQHYPACRGKCKPLLEWMLKDFDVEPAPKQKKTSLPKIIFENSDFCIIEKPSGMTSVAGKSERLSVEDYLKQHYGHDKDVRLVHRLDEDTSGLMIAAFGIERYKAMQRLFILRQIHKTYTALLSRDITHTRVPQEGTIFLPLLPDIYDRPRQRVSQHGRTAITHYRIIGADAAGRTRIEFHPITGRTHQLRVHAAAKEGLNAPIVGDRLYGIDDTSEYVCNSFEDNDKEENNAFSPQKNTKQAIVQPQSATRLMLHAAAIDFTSPFDGKKYHFESNKL